MKEHEEYSSWSNYIYPCSEDCGFIGELDAFTWGQCYNPCPNCGAQRIKRTGRFVYKITPVKWFPWFGRSKFDRVQWRN